MTRLPLLALAAIAPFSAALAQQAVPAAIAPGATRLDISATGDVHRVPDVATISSGVVTQAGSAARAMSDNAARMSATIAALREAGVADRDIQTSSIRLSPQYRYADNQPPALTGYQANNQVTVRLRDLARAGGVLDALAAAGANQIDGPNLAVDKPDDALDEARTAALAIARARAELYAKAAGLRVRRIVRIGETGAAEPPVQPMMVMVTARKRTDTPIEAGEQTLSVTLNVTFELG